VLTSTQILGTQSTKTGLYALENADLFNLLCIPPYLADGNVNAAVVTEAAQYCEARRAMLLVDPPIAWRTPADAIAGLGAVGMRDFGWRGLRRSGKPSGTAMQYHPPAWLPATERGQRTHV